jgi:hypothetical protein
VPDGATADAAGPVWWWGAGTVLAFGIGVAYLPPNTFSGAVRRRREIALFTIRQTFPDQMGHRDLPHRVRSRKEQPG